MKLEIRSIILLFIVVILSTFTYAKKWETLDFKVIQEVPDDITLVDVLKDQVGASWVQNKVAELKSITIDDVFIKEIERYLTEVSKRYQKMGFRFPRTDEQKDSKIIVYLYNYDDDSESLAKSGCTYIKDKERHCYIKLDSSRLLTSTSGVSTSKYLGVEIYEHLAHELFHSVQRAYPLFSEHANLGDWIVEGTAQAMGIAMLGEREKNVTKNNNLIRFYGVRPYSTPLRVKFDNEKRRHEGYHSSSLWTYIGEHISAYGHPEVKEVSPPDYSYLHTLFENNFIGKTSENKELSWLDSFLNSKESNINKKLAYIYPQFVTTFAYFTTTQEPYRHKASSAKGIENWHRCIFKIDCAIKDAEKQLEEKPCKQVYLDSQIPLVSISETFNKVASRCFEVFYKGSPLTDIAVKLTSDDTNVVKSIRALGMQKEFTPTQGATSLGKSIEVFTSKDITNSNTGKIKGAYWELKSVNFSNRASVLLVISNIAKNVKKTVSSPTVHFTFSLPIDEGDISLSNIQASQER